MLGQNLVAIKINVCSKMFYNVLYIRISAELLEITNSNIILMSETSGKAQKWF